MPAPRAVLADITDNGLDPKVAHRHTKKDGRIPAPAAPVAEEPPKLALKKLPEKKEEPAPKVEAKVVEEPKAEEPKKVETPVVEAKVEAKPEKPAKKEKAPKVVPTPEPVPAAEADDAKKA